jgi:hypothetical protein
MVFRKLGSDVASKRRLGALAFAAVVGGLMFAATPAQAWWRGGFVIGVPPVVVGAPLPYAYPYPYYPAPYPYPYPYPYPAYYPPAAPAAASAPAQQSASNNSTPVSYGTTCYAGVYVCQAPGSTPIGAGCSCPGLGAPSYGTVR